MTLTAVQFQRNRHYAVERVAHTQYLVFIHFWQKNDHALFVKKVSNNYLKVISKQYAHFQTMTLTPVKLQRNW